MTPVAKSAPFEWDFEREALHLCDANPSAAQRFVEAVHAAVELLAQHPEIGPVWRHGNPNHRTRYLLVPGFHNYLIFYRHEGRRVRLGRLLHGAQDLGDCCRPVGETPTEAVETTALPSSLLHRSG